MNFENKIVLAIAIRLAAERHMVKKINDPAFVAAIDTNQTPKLLKKYKELFSTDHVAIDVIQRVALMTPENIHLNSFMYEPILDMSDGISESYMRKRWLWPLKLKPSSRGSTFIAIGKTVAPLTAFRRPL